MKITTYGNQSIEIWCDICGIQIGSKHERTGWAHYPNDPMYDGFFTQERQYVDICNNCKSELIEVVHKTVERLKKKKEVR